MNNTKGMEGTCAIYLRLSKATDESTSIKRQRDDCLDFAEQNGWTVVDEFLDASASGYKDVKRPSRDELCERIAEFDHVVIWKMDRFARSMHDASKFYKLCEENGTQLSAVKGDIDLSTSQGRNMAHILASFAELESANIAERVESARRHLARTGRWSGGRTVYGYEIVDHPESGKTLKPLPVRAEAVQLMVRLILEGESCNAVAKALNAAGTPTARGGQWTSRTVKQVVTSRTMLGHVTSKGDVVRGEDSMPLVAWEPIMSTADFAEVERRLKQWELTKPRVGGMAAHSPLRGAVYCHECGKGMSKQDKGKRSKPYYRCGPLCGDQIAAHRLEPHVLSEILLFASQRPAIVIPGAEEADTSDIDQAIDDWLSDFVDGEISEDLFKKTAGRLEAKRDAIRQETPRREAQTLALSSIWEGLTLPERAAQIRDLCKVHVRRTAPRVRIEMLVETPEMTMIDESGIRKGTIDKEWSDEPTLSLFGPPTRENPEPWNTSSLAPRLVSDS